MARRYVPDECVGARTAVAGPNRLVRRDATMKALIAGVVFCVAINLSVSAAEPLGEPDLSQRLEQLEAETHALRAELETLRQAPVRLPPIPPAGGGLAGLDASGAVAAMPAIPSAGELPEQIGKAPEAAPAPGLTLEAAQAEMKKLVWTKGDFKLVPYGMLWADMIYATQRNNPGSYTFWINSADVDPEDAFAIDARRSRLGFDITGPDIPLFHCASSSGRVEIDFEGEFVLENKGSVLLRHAYWQVKDEDFLFLFGQTSDIISPLVPGTLNYSVQWNAGNIGYRRAQFRAERYYNVSDRLLITAQGSLNQDIVTDFTAEPGVRRESANWPVIQGRLAATLGPRGEHCLPAVVGVSSHIGETGFDFLSAGPPPLSLPPEQNFRAITWSINGDVRIPFTPYFGFQGEVFTGENLSAFLGGIGQGVCGCLRGPVASTGGWMELWYDWNPRLHSHVGYNIDNPRDEDMLFGRSLNSAVFANIVYDLTPKLNMGFEVSHWRTEYMETRGGLIPDNLLRPDSPGEATIFQWMVMYGF